MLIGVINLSLSAKYFGVSFKNDIWILSLTITLFIDAIIWGPVNETFRTKFIFIKNKEGYTEAIGKTKSLVFFTFFISIIIVGIIEFFPEVIVGITAPYFNGQELENLMQMIRFVAPILLINQLNLLGISILNAFNSFFIPEISGLLTSLINLILIVFLAPIIGIYSLVISYYLGVFVLFLLIIYQLKHLKINIFKGISQIRFKDFLVFFVYALPFFLPYFFGQISNLLEKTLSGNFGQGNVSVIDYSRKFTDILVNVWSSVLLTILVPVLSENYSQNKTTDFVSSFFKMYKMGFLFFSFVLTFFSVCSDSIVDLFYNRGSISNVSLELIKKITLFYSWSSFAIFIYLSFGLALLSMGRNREYAFYGVGAQILTITLNLLFINSLGIIIFPLSLFISHFLAGVLMLLKFPFSKFELLITSAKYLLALLISLDLTLFINIIINLVLIVFIMIAMLFVFNLEEKNIFINIFKN